MDRVTQIDSTTAAGSHRLGYEYDSLDRMSKRYLSGTGIATSEATTYLVIRIVASLMQGYSWQEMDWRQRGSTSIGDFFAASGIGKREINQEGKKCVEYFAYKDGLPVKVVCSK